MSDSLLTIIILACTFLCFVLGITAFIYYIKKKHDAYISSIATKLSIESHNDILSNHILQNSQSAAVLHRHILEQDEGSSQEGPPLEIKTYDTGFHKSQQRILSALNAFDNSSKENTQNGSSANSSQK